MMSDTGEPMKKNAVPSFALTLRSTLHGIFSMTLVSINTILWVLPLLPVAMIKLLIPAAPWRRFWGRVATGMAECWISVNNANIRLTQSITWDIRGLTDLSKDKWYLVIANHQSWVDIIVLQNIFNRKIPFLKFFLKKELIWVPLLGLGWWALDFPFMKRYSRQTLEKHPELKGRDMEITRRACGKFRTMPVSVMNFVEGTRFSPEKRIRGKSPYTHLLQPKAGGIGFVLTAMGEQLTSILNVTIIYPDNGISFWEFLCGKLTTVTVIIEEIPMTKQLLGDYVNDQTYQRTFRTWLNELWKKNDSLFS